MCVGLVLLDLVLLFGVIALILWILAITSVIPIAGGIIHIFIVIAVVLLIVWLIFRIFNIGGYGYGRGRNGAIV